MNPNMGLALGGIFGMAFFMSVFYAGGWWLLLAPLGLLVMLLGIAIGSRL